MAIIKKYGETLTQNLTNFGTFITDVNPNSTYFKITEFHETFTGGKNGFLIEGSEHLKETTEIKIQILDVEGAPIYFEPGDGVPEYYEGTSKVVSVYVYQDTPIGQATITVLGELKTYVDGDGVTQTIPDEWKDVYNVKWEKTFKVNRLLPNEDKVRFYKRPTVSIAEVVKPIFSNVVNTITKTGTLQGIPLVPSENETFSKLTIPTSYLLRTTDSTFWTGSMIDSTISLPSLNFDGSITEILNSTDLLIKTPYNENGLVKSIDNTPYSISWNYTEGLDNLKTALTGSFAKINITDLTTFVGDVARVKIFRKSTSDVSDFQFVQEIQLESNEILVDLESTTKNQENYGLFDKTNYKSYWCTSSNNIIPTFDQSFLFNSVKLQSPSSVNSYYTTKSLNITEGIEYSLDFNIRKETIGNTTDYIQVYLSGSRASSVNGNPITIQVKQNIVTLKTQNALLQKQNITENIKAESIDNARLYFDVIGSDWHIADVSFKASQETAFSPDEITFIQSVPRSLPVETFVYRFEFYDINNNYIPVNVEATKTFDGGNLQTIRKQLRLVPSSLYFQFDSGSNPIPPTVITIQEQKTLLTGSVRYTSASIDFDGNVLKGDDYTASFTGKQYPGVLTNIGTNTPYLTVGNFTGSRGDKTVQFLEITGEVEGFTDTIVISRVLDGFGGVNHLIRPYRGTDIRNSSTQSLEIQAIRIDGVNDIELSSTTQPNKGWTVVQLHVLSASLNPQTEPEYFINIQKAVDQKFIQGVTVGELGSKELNYNAVFNRDSIDKRRTIYLLKSGSVSSQPAYIASASILASIILNDLQDGLDSGLITYNTDVFNVNFRNGTNFTPSFAYATASFTVRGTNDTLVTASFQVYPSMSINYDFVPEYWLYYTTQSCETGSISVIAYDENKNEVISEPVNSLGLANRQSKKLTVTFTYTEPYTSASATIDKTFTIVPEGKPGDESIVFEYSPQAITMQANSRGFVSDYKPTITDIKLKQGSRYLVFTGSIDGQKNHGTFHIAQASIKSSNITGGLVYYDNRYTESLIISASSDFTNLSGSIEFPLIIHPYYTSSIYTASIVQNYTKVMDGPPPLQVIISPSSVALTADEVGYITADGYVGANTTIQVKDGEDFLTFTTQSSAPGTFRIQTGASIVPSNIQVDTITSSSAKVGVVKFNRFDYPYISASAVYNIVAFPYALGPGFMYTSSIVQRTQSFTKNVTPPNARAVSLSATSQTVNFDRDGVVISPEGDITLAATAFNATGSVYYQFFKNNTDQSGIQSSDTYTIASGDATSPGETATWKVKIRDGNAATTAPIRAESEITIIGVKSGADAYTENMTNESAAISANIWDTVLTGTGTRINAYKGQTELTHVSSFTNQTYDLTGEYIGSLGQYRVSIDSKSSHITLAGGLIPGQVLSGAPVAQIADITAWTDPQTNPVATVVYEIDFEDGRELHYKTQSFTAQIEPAAPYSAQQSNGNAAAVYRVSGEFELGTTGNVISAYRGSQVLTHTTTFTGGQTDYNGNVGYKNKFRVVVASKSAHITLGGSKIVTSTLNTSGNNAVMPQISTWTDPETNQTATITYTIDYEGRSTQTLTQTFTVQFEGNTGPGIVMRGVWKNDINYIGSVETTNYRRDAVIYPDPSTVVGGTTTYYASVSGSGPATYGGDAILVGAQSPTVGTDNAYWQFLGEQEFFIAAKIAIFDESYVKNTINVGTKDTTGAFANIVIAGGRPDPYIALGQTGTQGTAGTSGTSLSTAGVIGYDRPGIFLGIYESGTAGTGVGTSGRFSIKNTSGTKYLKWTGGALEIKGDITADNGTFNGTVNAAAGNFTGYVTAGTMRLGKNVVGTDSGLWINSNNYWFDDGTFNLGNASNYINWNGAVLNVTGEINILPGGNAATQTYASASGAAASAAGFSMLSASLGAMAAIDSINTGQNQTYIGPGVIVTNMIATNALVSTNYSYTSGNFTDAGSFFSLASGEIISPGFAVKPNGNAFFKGVIEAFSGKLGSWKLDPTTLNSDSNRISLNSTDDSISILDTGGNLRFLANTATSLPDIGGTAPSPATLSAGTTVYTHNSTNGVGNGTATEYHNFGTFTTAAGAAKHLITWTYNPAGSSNSYSDAQGDGNASLTVQMVLRNPSTGVVLFTGTVRSTEATGTVECDGGPYRVSVVGDTEITLSDGSIKLAKDIINGDIILSWNSEEEKFDEGEVYNFTNRHVDFVYVVSCGGRLLKVSDSHAFWTYGENDEIPVQNLIAGESKIYVKVGDNIELKLVDDVYKLNVDEKVYSFTVPTFKNYVSNNIISHNIAYPGGCNAIGDTEYFTEPETYVIQADLSASTSYQLSLQMTYEVLSDDTFTASSFNSDGRTRFEVGGGTATITRVSAGTVINGGGFQAVISDNNYLKISAGTGTMVKGTLYLPDGQIDSDSGIAGWGPAVKAFCRLLYNGGAGGASVIGNYSMQSAYNMASVSINATYKLYQHNFTTDLGTDQYSTLVSITNVDYVSNNITNMVMIIAQTSSYTQWRVKLLNNNVDYINQQVVGGFAGVVVIGK